MDFDISFFDVFDVPNDAFDTTESDIELEGSFHSTPSPVIEGGFDHYPGIGSSFDGTDVTNDDMLPHGAEDIVPNFDDWCSAEYGTPIEDAMFWHEQTTPFTCGIVSSEMIMNMFGLDISESQLTYEATSQGLLTENGITIEGIQQLLENHGIETSIGKGDISDLQLKLDGGHKIIIPLDSGEIWKNDSMFEDLFSKRADHAVVITGIDTDSISPKVFLNDPGHPDGQAMKVDMDVFLDAWNDSENQYIATDRASIV